MIMTLNEEISELDEIILKMSAQVRENLKYGMDAYLYYDPNKEYEPINDAIVNSYERQVEGKALNIMLKERLYGSDIRLVSGIMTMVEDLERLGDHAQDLMTFALKLKNSENHKNAEILAMAQFTMKMVDDSIKSYITKDVELAQDVIQRDDVVDRDYDKLLDYLVEAGKDRDVSSAFVVYTTLVVKYIERIADHSTNIAEWVVYIITGYYKDTQIL